MCIEGTMSPDGAWLRLMRTVFSLLDFAEMKSLQQELLKCAVCMEKRGASRSCSFHKSQYLNKPADSDAS